MRTVQEIAIDLAEAGRELATSETQFRHVCDEADRIEQYIAECRARCVALREELEPSLNAAVQGPQ